VWAGTARFDGQGGKDEFKHNIGLTSRKKNHGRNLPWDTTTGEIDCKTKTGVDVIGRKSLEAKTKVLRRYDQPPKGEAPKKHREER